MVCLNCVVVGGGSPFSISIDLEKNVDDLKVKIKERKNQSIHCEADRLELYHTSNGNSEVDEHFLRELKQQGSRGMTVKYVNDIAWMYPFKLLKGYFDANPPKKQVHVLVVVPEQLPSNASDAEPLHKKAKPIQKDVVYQGPVSTESYSVPMESIDVYVRVSGLFLSAATARPLCLLYGPRQFGKTTISHRLWNLLASDPSILVIYHAATELSVTTEADFWSALIGFCRENGSTSQDLLHILLRRTQRLLLMIDEMDEMFVNTKLTSTFLNVLREWQAAPYFCGFLGIGSYKLVSLCEHHKRSYRSSPSNLCTLFPVKRFSHDPFSN
ncbi:hypothetical protein AC1031_005050 [Aphanomyces cochlioides]|nr:hypothetical protein AC1031_005050 [Aphanomyces cochlioides]